jgi:hypothetical protein
LKNIALALLAALALVIGPLADLAVHPRLDGRLARESRNGFDFHVDIAL